MIIRIKTTIFDFFFGAAHKNEKKKKNVPEMFSKDKFWLQAVVAMQLCVVVFREGWVLRCLICCEASISRTQQSPGWPSGPAVSDTSSPSCPAASPDSGGPTWRRAHRSSSPQPTTHSGQQGGENGDLVISVSPTCTSSPSSCFFFIFGPAPEMKTPPRLFLP